MVKSVEYNEKTGTLKATHHDGNIVCYHLVSPKVFDKYLDCKSPDEFIRRFIQGQFFSTHAQKN